MPVTRCLANGPSWKPQMVGFDPTKKDIHDISLKECYALVLGCFTSYILHVLIFFNSYIFVSLIKQSVFWSWKRRSLKGTESPVEIGSVNMSVNPKNRAGFGKASWYLCGFNPVRKKVHNHFLPWNLYMVFKLITQTKNPTPSFSPKKKQHTPWPVGSKNQRCTSSAFDVLQGDPIHRA